MTVTPALQHPLRPLSIVVASQNRVKINAVAAAVQQAFPGAKHVVTGAASQSGVPDQPFGDEETLRGACNRLASLAAEPQHSGSLLCAIEGGIGWAPALPLPCTSSAAGGDEAAMRPGSQQQQQSQKQQLECFAWVALQAPGGRCSHARSASFLLPEAVSRLILEQGMELGAADDRVWGRVNSGQGSGTIGKLTGGLITRQAYYEHAVSMALVPLMNPSLYPKHAGPAGAAAGTAAPSMGLPAKPAGREQGES